MKKSFKLENLGCAVCAAKMEDAVSKIDGVKSATVSFMMQRITICADDELFDEIVKKADKAVKKFEPDCHIVF